MFTFTERGEYLHRNIQTKGERRKKKEISAQRKREREKERTSISMGSLRTFVINKLYFVCIHFRCSYYYYSNLLMI